MGLRMRINFPFSNKCSKILFIRVIVSEHDCFTNSFLSFSFCWISFRASARLLHRELCLSSAWLNNFERVTPISYNTKLRMQFAHCGGLHTNGQVIFPDVLSCLIIKMNEWFSDWNNMIVEIFTDRNVIQCSGPPSLYNIKNGRMLSLLSYVVTKTPCYSAAFLKVLEGSVAVIFKNS